MQLQGLQFVLIEYASEFQNKLVISLWISGNLCVAVTRLQRIFSKDSMELNQSEKISNHRKTGLK